MIIKHLSIKNESKSNFSKLLEYLLKENKKEFLGEIKITNCVSEDPKDLALEVALTQSMNTRSKKDKNFHFVVSFPRDENPSNKILEDIEKNICDCLGFKDHQRISVVHLDTENLHVHVVVNKIHPQKYTIHEPYYPYKTFSKIAQTLEKKHNLKFENHSFKKTISKGNIKNYEKQTGFISLASWIKRECLENLKKAENWNEFHQLLYKHGLSITKKSNGFVFSTLKGLHVKASNVDRTISKKELEKRMGAFKAFENEALSELVIEKQYSRTPLNNNSLGQKLYTQFLNEKKLKIELKKELLHEEYNKKIKTEEYLKNKYQFKHNFLKLFGFHKSINYKSNFKSLKKEFEKNNKNYQERKRKIMDEYKFIPWNEWLQNKALFDKNALSYLKSLSNDNFSKEIRTGFSIDKKNDQDNENIKTPEFITKKGSTYFLIDDQIIREENDFLIMNADISNEKLEKIIDFGIKKYGQTFSVAGSKEFQKKVKTISEKKNLNLSFKSKKFQFFRR